MRYRRVLFSVILMCVVFSAGCLAATGATADKPHSFPPPLSSYGPQEGKSLPTILLERIKAEPFNAVATGLFFMAIIHTFLASRFLRLAHKYQHNFREAAMEWRSKGSSEPLPDSVTRLRFRAEIFHLLGEVEAIFGIWVVPLLIAITIEKGWEVARDYIGHGLNFTEPLFVVVIMAIASSRPVLNLAESVMALTAGLRRSSPATWWLSILMIGPLLGSFITEPAAMTICALLLARKFYEFKPSARLSYATLGLLFVNISVGGTLTHFAAPPVLMVAGKWGWGFTHMLVHFGWKAVLGIAIANTVYFLVFRKELKALVARAGAAGAYAPPGANSRGIPIWITCVHIFFLAWTVMNNHYPALFIGGFLFYIAFTRATEEFQSELSLRPALLVGFFLAGLVVHGGLQGWWIGPTLRRMSEDTLFFGAVFLTAFNDNAAITYLASLVPDFGEQMKYAVVAGAVVGGGLTVIANAPNPAGQSILSRFFPDGISPLYLLLGAAIPTILIGSIFVIFSRV